MQNTYSRSRVALRQRFLVAAAIRLIFITRKYFHLAVPHKESILKKNRQHKDTLARLFQLGENLSCYEFFDAPSVRSITGLYSVGLQEELFGRPLEYPLVEFADYCSHIEGVSNISPAHPVIDRRRLLHKRRPWFAPNEAYHLFAKADSEIGSEPNIAELCDWLSKDATPNAGIFRRIPSRYVDRKLSMSGVKDELLRVAAEVLENATSSSIPHLLGNSLAWEDVVTEVNLVFIQEILEAAVGVSRYSSPALVPPVHAAVSKLAPLICWDALGPLAEHLDQS